MIAIGIRLHAQELDRGTQLLVELARPVDVSRAEGAHQLPNLRTHHLRVDADPTDTTGLEERKDEIVVARVEVEPAVDDVSCCVEARLRLLHAADVLDLRERRDGLGLCVDDDAARDVVEDHGPVGRGGDGLDVSDDSPLRWLVVVRRDDEHSVDTELVRALRQVDRVGGRVGPRARDDGTASRGDLEGGLVEREALVVGERRRLPGRPGHDEPVGARVQQEPAERTERRQVERAVRAERRHHRGQDLAEHWSPV